MGKLCDTKGNQYILEIVFFLILLFNTFTITKLPIRDLAFMTMEWSQYSMIFILGYCLKARVTPFPVFRPLYSGMVLFASVYILIHLVTGKLEVSDDLSNAVMVLVFVLGVAHVKWRDRDIALFAFISVGLLLLFFVKWLTDGMSAVQYQSYTRNSNIFGVLVACLVYFPIAAFQYVRLSQRIYYTSGIVASLILIYASSARAALLLLVIAICARGILALSRRLFYYLFHAVMIINVIFVLIYGWLAKSRLFSALNDWSVDQLGKRLFSGRQDIWEPALEYGLQKPFFGYFIQILPEDYIKDTSYVHAHNQYLQLFLESGIIGLACFVLLLFGIWKVYQRKIDSGVVRWSACFFIGILFYQSVEISLFDNMQAIGLIQWFILAIGLGAVLRKKEAETGSTAGKRRMDWRE